MKDSLSELRKQSNLELVKLEAVEAEISLLINRGAERFLSRNHFKLRRLKKKRLLLKDDIQSMKSKEKAMLRAVEILKQANHSNSGNQGIYQPKISSPKMRQIMNEGQQIT